MRVLILSTSIVNGFQRFSELSENNNAYLCLICNSKKNDKITFLFQQLFQIIFRLSFPDNLNAIRSILKKTIKITGENIHSKKTLDWIGKKNIDIGIHGINVIYKKKLLDCFKLGILNAHLGLLPQYRGKSVVAWSLLENSPTGISTFLIDKGIDTGKNIILSEQITLKDIENSLKAKKYLSSKTGEMYKKAINKINDPNFTFIENDVKLGKRYYSMSKLFTDYIDTLLKSNL